MRAIPFLIMLAAASMAYGADADSTPAAHDYDNAAKQAEQKVANASAGAEDYYNLGLARDKQGDVAQASLNYERALQLDPGLHPARNALATLASSKSIPLAPHSWRDDVNAVIHPDALVAVGASLFWAGAFGLLLAGQIRRHRTLVRTLAILAVLVGTVAETAGWLTDGRLALARPAVVTAKDGVEVLTAPANNSTPVVTLPSGTPVGVLSPRGSWTYIDVNGGARGWVQTDRLTPVTPGETLL
jgi:hypothetical protein